MEVKSPPEADDSYKLGKFTDGAKFKQVGDVCFVRRQNNMPLGQIRKERGNIHFVSSGAYIRKAELYSIYDRMDALTMLAEIGR
jgi:hypothetical protein